MTNILKQRHAEERQSYDAVKSLKTGYPAFIKFEGDSVVVYRNSVRYHLGKRGESQDALHRRLRIVLGIENEAIAGVQKIAAQRLQDAKREMQRSQSVDIGFGICMSKTEPPMRRIDV